MSGPRRSWGGLLLGSIALAIVLGGCLFVLTIATEVFDTNVNPGKGQRTSSPYPTSEALAADSGPSFPGKQPNDFASNAGEWVNYNSGVNVLASPIQPYRAGSKRLCTQVTIRNSSGETASFSYIDWKLQDPAGVIREAEYTDSKDALESGELASGGTITGLVCFEPKSSAAPAPGTWVVLMEPGFLSSERIAWVNWLS